MTTKTKPEGSEVTLDSVEFEHFPIGVIPGKGSKVLGRFVRLDRSKVGFKFAGQSEEVFPWIVIFEGVDGGAFDRDGNQMVIERGEVYSLWLIHGLLMDLFKMNRPQVGELFAVEGHGKREKRNPSGDNDSYWSYGMAMPEREKPAPLTWDDM